MYNQPAFIRKPNSLGIDEPAFIKKPVALGIDVGYSSTKFSYMNGEEIVTGSFPSIALRGSRATFGSAMESMGAREADLRIEVDGAVYLVNTSELEVISSSAIRTENDEFSTTKEYTALVYSAMLQSQLRDISELVLALPMHTFTAYAPLLMQKFRGRHEFGHGAFTIHNVSVLPQPVGAYSYLRYKNPSAFVAGTFCCVIDCGWNTTDTFTSSPGFKIDHERSGGLPGGAARVLREISALLQRKYKGRFSNLDRIDQSIVNETPLIHLGEEIDLTPFLQAALHVTVPIARSVLTTIKTAEDLTIFLAGGAGHYYRAALRETLGCNVKLLDNPRFANAIGFMLAGESFCRGRR
ncbi:plasmid segregation protein ParM [Paraburkholderia atlantica]|uniref:ParM/StbA family protein n=1 Tax=Paraburkholderia atlantica TaxID=2654982 RepID=UPI003D199ED3